MLLSNAADVTALGPDDVVPQRVLGEPAVHDVTAVGLQMAAQLLFFLGFAAVVGGGHVHAHRDAAIDLEVGMKAPAAVGVAILIGQVGGLRQIGKGAHHAAIDGGQHLRDGVSTDRARPRNFPEQLADDRYQPRRVKDIDGLGECAERSSRATEPLCTFRSVLACWMARSERTTGLNKASNTSRQYWS